MGNSMSKKMAAALAVALAAGAALADAVTIANVKAEPVSPWNKVYLHYDVTGTLPADAADYVLTVAASNRTTGAVIHAGRVTGDTALTLGRHQLVWDLAADGLDLGGQSLSFTVTHVLPTYLVIDLAGGTSAASYPVSGLSSVPSGGWSGEHKTTKLVLRCLKAGTYQMQNSGTVTLTHPFYIGVFEVTQRQWELVMGTKPSYFSGDARPVEKVSYNMIRGSSAGAGWPASSAVDATSFLGLLRAKTGLSFDLPTEAQWEYACRAGTTTTYSYGDSADGAYMWYCDNADRQTHDVGTRLPNAWGLYDMHGNVFEWCLDWYGSLAYGTDPLGSSSGSYRVSRGGGWNCYADYWTSSCRDGGSPSYASYYYGFRLVRTLSNNE